jgi:hypothetical protein
VNGYSLNWALGYLINELNRDDFLPYENPPRKLGLSLFLTFTITISIVLILLFASIVYKMLLSNKKNSQQYMQNLLSENALENDREQA